MNAIEFHDAIATEFDSRYNSSMAFGERFRVWTELFVRFVKPGDQVMDLGCGSGIFSNHLAERGCIVTAIDGSASMIALANQKKRSVNVDYRVQSLPFGDLPDIPPQDIVIASSLLEYVNDMTLVLQQSWTILKPGGLLVASVPNRLSLYRRLERVLFALTGYPRYFAHNRHVSTESEFNRQLNGLGFQRVEIAYFSGSDPVSSVAKWLLPKRYVNNLFVGVYRKR